MTHSAIQMPIREMLFGTDADETVLSARAYDDGSLLFTITGVDRFGNRDLTLGQTIQLRDFLNCHIDGLALQQIGSLAERASDDPTQLASVEEIPVKPTVRLPGVNGHEYDPLAVADFRAQCVVMLAEQGVAVEVDAGVLAWEKTMQRPPAWDTGHRAAPFNPDRYKKD